MISDCNECELEVDVDLTPMLQLGWSLFGLGWAVGACCVVYIWQFVFDLRSEPG